MLEKWKESSFLTKALFLLIIAAFCYILFLLRPVFGSIFLFMKAVFGPFFVAIIISYLLNPIVNHFSDRGMPRSLAVLLIYTLFIGCMVILFINMIPIFGKQLNELIEHLPEWNRQVQYMVQEYNDHGKKILPPGVQHGIQQAIDKMQQSLGDAVGNAMSGIGNRINQLFMVFVIPFLAFYMLKDMNELEMAVFKWLPREKRSSILRLIRSIDQALGNYIRGQFLVCLIIGILAYIGYLIIKLPYALLFAGIVGITNIIPYVGPFLGAIPALLVAAVISKKVVIGVIIVNIVCQLLESNVISPQIVGRSLHLHPLSIFFALLVGEELAGIIGLILAVPILAVGKVIFAHIIEHYVNQRTV